jgi:preprotein translocase subunit SecA
MVRKDQSDLIYKNEEIKFQMVVDDIVDRNKLGQPVLVGTTSVEKSEYLSSLLSKHGIRHEVLNAKNNASEAEIVAQAGRLSAVTVATNMAGRGTDIMLGGNAEFLAVSEAKAKGLDPNEDPERYEAEWDAIFARVSEQVEAEGDKVREVGGLYVLGTERHESRRIDNQLRGRSGRQGDPGESRFYLSLTDDLMRLFNSGAAASIMNRGGIPDDQAIESGVVSRAIASAQSQVEGRNAEIRKNILKYDDVMNNQRLAIYADRTRILEGDDVQETITDFLEGTLKVIVEQKIPSGNADWELEELWEELSRIYPIGLEIDEVMAEAGARSKVTREWLLEELISDAKFAYQRRTEELGEEIMRDLERRVILSVLDRKWRDHLYEMDYLKEGIGLRSMAQRDPLVEYQREGHTMFMEMMAGIREETVSTMFRVEIKKAPELEQPKPGELTLSAPTEGGGVRVQQGDKVEESPATQPAGSKGQTLNRAQRRAQAKKPPRTGPGSSFFKS